MNSNENLQKDPGGANQAEFFPELAKAARRRRPLRADMAEGRKTFLNITYENALFMLIGIIMALIVAFGLGVERGKCAAKRYYALQQKPNKAEASSSLSREPIISDDERVNKTASAETSSAKAVLSKAQPDFTGSAAKAAATFFTVQVASFKKKSTAEQELFKLKGMRYDAFLKDDGSWTCLYVGRYRTHDEAQSALKVLKGKYGDAYVRTLANN